MKDKNIKTSKTTFEDLITTFAKLRDPETGCPWDLSQAHKSLKPHLL